MKARQTFHISRKPVVSLAETEESHDLGNGLGLPRLHGSPRLLAIARDPWTIFAYWNVDWPSISNARSEQRKPGQVIVPTAPNSRADGCRVIRRRRRSARFQADRS